MERKINIILGTTIPPNSDIENGNIVLEGNFYEKFTRMNRALENWQKAINGKIEVKVSEENKEWLLTLMEETRELIGYFNHVFDDI